MGDAKAGGGFAAGTLVHTKQGLKPIETLSVGDWVLSYPDDQVPPQRLREENEYVYRQVTGSSSRDNEPVCVVIAWDLGNNFKEEIMMSRDHPLYIKGAGWTPAGVLKFGNTLVCSEFANLLVKKRLDASETARVHSIQVEGLATYYVGKLGAWVHEGGG